MTSQIASIDNSAFGRVDDKAISSWNRVVNRNGLNSYVADFDFVSGPKLIANMFAVIRYKRP
jgi:hypothetical protein